jgi:hypothetical protein
MSRPRSQTHTRVALAAVCLVVAAASASACYEDPNDKLNQLQQITDMTDVVNELNSRTSELLFTVDSLRGVMARQDTTIARLANLAGVPYR